jgi:RNA polymerase sigma-70 factor (ECF subfamily)
MRARWLRRFLRLTDTGEAPDVVAVDGDDEARDVVRRYYRVLARLGGTARSLFVAREIERLSLDQAAALHGCSVSTAQRRLARITRRVAAMVADDPVLARYLTRSKGEPQ